MSYFVKKNVLYQEYFIHSWVYSLVQSLNKKKETKVYIKVPKIISYDEKGRTLTMHHLNGDNLSNIYGDNFDDVPPEHITKIRNFIQILDAYR